MSDATPTGELIEVKINYPAVKEQFLRLWSDPRQLGFREAIRRDPEMMAWLNPPEIEEPETAYVRVVTLEVALRDGYMSGDAVADVLTEAARNVVMDAQNVGPDRYVRIFLGKLGRPGDVFDAPPPHEDWRRYHPIRSGVIRDMDGLCVIEHCGMSPGALVHNDPDFQYTDEQAAAHLTHEAELNG